MNAKRLATVLLLVVALAAASTALAQAQRWEYAVLRLYHDPARDSMGTISLTLAGPDVLISANSVGEFEDKLAARYGPPPFTDGWYLAQVINTLGHQGWELVTITTDEYSGIFAASVDNYYFKRPIP